MSTNRFLRAATLTIATAITVAGCQNAGNDLGFAAFATGTINVAVYLDRDGSHTPTLVVDTVYRNARVALLPRGSNDTLRTVTSDATGLARFDAVPVGEYRLAVTQASIGDSLVVGAIDSTNVRVRADDTEPVQVVVRLSYPEVTIQQARALQPGKRAFIRGVVLVGVPAFRDNSTHLSDNSGQIRLTRVLLRTGLSFLFPGDSVSALGTSSSQDGQPTLDLALISKFGSRPPPIPLPISTASAATANGGALDAALVQVIGAIISDTVTVAPDFKVTASDGTGPVNIILDANLPFSRTAFRPNRSINVKGVLVPNGLGGWNLKPRDVSDVTIN